MATSAAGYALLWRRGTPRQLAVAMLVCLASAVLILPAAVWDQLRLQLLGPLLSEAEVAFWLSWVALTGWILPLTGAAAYVLLAEQQGEVRRLRGQGQPAPAKAARVYEPLGAGVPWAWLTALDGPFEGRRLALSKEITLLGRHVQNDICIDTDLASRYHARLYWDHGRGYLVDCQSLNGTTVNGQRMEIPALLQTGDVVGVGGRRFQFAYAGAVAEPRPTPSDETTELTTVAPGSRMDLLSAELVGLTGALAGRQFPLRTTVITLGRDAENVIVLSSAAISRWHAQIVRQEQGDYLQDLGSRNGTLVNGARITAPRLLQPRDEVRLGDMDLRYQCERAVLPATVDDRQRRSSATPPEIPVALPEQDTHVLHLPLHLGLPPRIER